MIEFSGKITGECRKYRQKIESCVGFFVSLIISVCILIPIIFACIYIDWIFILVIIPLIIFVILATLVPLMKSGKDILPIRVSIGEDNVIESESAIFHDFVALKKVKKVIDMGQWYQIVLIFPNKSARFVCQKDLLVKGTLKDFENIFKNKIVRRFKKNSR